MGWGLEFGVFRIDLMVMYHYLGFAFGLDWSQMCKQPVEISPDEVELRYPPCRYIWFGFTVLFINVSGCIRPWGIPEELRK
jgi:hypothetical protein